ncbi:hypothetical protein JCM10213v2_005859 [Rhodosporidiobolus nylandii]
MAAHKRRKAKLKQNKPLPSISKEQSCQTCRVRKIRCTQERPACQQCRKSAIARGHPAEGVRCHYSAASVFAKDGDAEFELELGGRERGCFWGDQPEGVEASTAAPGASIRDTPAFAEDDGREGVAVAAVLPPVVKRDAAFWDGGPLSPEEINGWSGLLYVAKKCEMRF